MRKDNLTKIACIGDSLTFGLTLDVPEEDSYPNRLQMMLGDGFVVNPYLGRNGAGVWRSGFLPYVGTRECREAVAWMADVLVVCLGTNDTFLPMTDSFRQEFVDDYVALLGELKKNSQEARFFLCLIPPIPACKELAPAVSTINGMIADVASACHATLIDLHTPFLSKNELFSDGIHPNEAGARLIAETVFRAL